MSLSAIIVGLLLAGLTAYAVIVPWRRQARKGAGQPDEASLPAQSSVTDLEARAESSYAALSDLDFDRNVGKLNDDDYQLVRGQLMAQTVEVLQRLDSEAADAESQVEALVRARRGRRSAPAPSKHGRNDARCPSCGAPARPGDRYCGRCGTELGHACPACGAAVKPGDLFCVRCGSTLAMGAAA